MDTVSIRGRRMLWVMLLLLITACGAKEGQEGNLIYLSSYSFAPSTVTVKAGSKVNLQLHNNESFWGEPHDWTLMEAGYTAEPPWTDEDSQHVLVQRLVLPSEDEPLSFTAPSEPGEYQIVCTNYFQNGMQGTLVVTP